MSRKSGLLGCRAGAEKPDKAFGKGDRALPVAVQQAAEVDGRGQLRQEEQSLETSPKMPAFPEQDQERRQEATAQWRPQVVGRGAENGVRNDMMGSSSQPAAEVLPLADHPSHFRTS